MTRRIVSSLCLAVFLGGGMAAFAAPASADDTICIGGENQRKPGGYQGICVGDPVEAGNLLDHICKLGG